MTISPRQARDKQRESTQKESGCVFLQAMTHCDGINATASVRKTASFFEVSLCLSRACLGKMIVFIYKWLKNAVRFSQEPIDCDAALVSAGFDPDMDIIDVLMNMLWTNLIFRVLAVRCIAFGPTSSL
jgi:hypothetical protein